MCRNSQGHSAVVRAGQRVDHRQHRSQSRTHIMKLSRQLVWLWQRRYYDTWWCWWWCRTALLTHSMTTQVLTQRLQGGQHMTGRCYNVNRPLDTMSSYDITSNISPRCVNCIHGWQRHMCGVLKIKHVFTPRISWDRSYEIVTIQITQKQMSEKCFTANISIA